MTDTSRDQGRGSCPPCGNLADRLFRVALVLMALGTVFVFSAGASLSRQWSLDRIYTHPGLRQLLFLPVAIAVTLGVARIDHRVFSLRRGPFRSVTPYLVLISTILLILVLFVGPEINFARRWLILGLGPVKVSFQPSELAKWSMIFLCAAWCEAAGYHLHDLKRQILPLAGIVGLVVGLILMEDFGTAAFVALLCFCLLLAGGARYRYLLAPIPLAAGAFYWALFQYPHRMKRLLAFLHPDRFSDTVAYQATQSLIALGSGGLVGKGLGGGICKYGHLPEDTTDFVFAIIGEELGLVGAAGTILLFMAFLFYGLLVITRCRDDFSRLLATGIVLAVGIQAALNVGVVTVVLPTKGIPLPFISRGGTSLLLSSAALGVLLNIARQTDHDAREAVFLPTSE